MEVVHRAVPDISVNLGLALLVFFEKCIPFANHKSLDGAKAAKVLRIFCGMSDPRQRVAQTRRARRPCAKVQIGGCGHQLE